MIRANVRCRLEASDLQLVVSLLSQGAAGARASWERRLASEGPDVLLDAPELFERLLAMRSIVMPSAPLFLYVTMRHALRSAGIDDRELADYLAAMVLDFGQRDRAWRIDWHDDQVHRYLVDILGDLEATGDAPRRFAVMVHLGNYALWLAGIFPDYIAVRHRRKGGPDVTYYDAIGRQGFALAAEHALAATFGLDDTFRHAAERFPRIRSALNVVSDQVFFTDTRSSDRRLRDLGAY